MNNDDEMTEDDLVQTLEVNKLLSKEDNSVIECCGNACPQKYRNLN